MKKKTKNKKKWKGEGCGGMCHGSMGSLYGLGGIGALVYYISTA